MFFLFWPKFEGLARCNTYNYLEVFHKYCRRSLTSAPGPEVSPSLGWPVYWNSAEASRARTINPISGCPRFDGSTNINKACEPVNLASQRCVCSRSCWLLLSHLTISFTPRPPARACYDCLLTKCWMLIVIRSSSPELKPSVLVTLHIPATN